MDLFFDALALPSGLRLDDLVLTSSAVIALVVSTDSSAKCPGCGTASDRVHSRYRRSVADLPCQERLIVLRLIVRRFRCTHPCCPQRIFGERPSGLTNAHARSTSRLAGAHRLIGFALGGEAVASAISQRFSRSLLSSLKKLPDRATVTIGCHKRLGAC